MKKTLITALLVLSLASAASAGVETDALLEFGNIGNITSDITKTNTSGSATASRDGSYVTLTDNATDWTGSGSHGLSYWSTDDQCDSMVTFTLDLTTLLADFNDSSKTIPAKTSLIEFHSKDAAAGGDIGLLLTSSGTLATYYDSANLTTTGTAFTLFTQGDDSTWRLSDSLAGKSSINMVMISWGSGAWLYAEGINNGASVAGAGGIRSSSNYRVETITLNADYIDYVNVYAMGTNQTANISELYGYATAAAVPEPATATLSLLALAGLAARRRRK